MANCRGGDSGKHGHNKFEYRQNDPSEEIDEFWTTRSNGLAVLATPEMMRTFRLASRPKPLTEVADRFHLTPLIRAMTSPHDVFVLALSEERVRLVHVFVSFPPVEIKIAQLPKMPNKRPGAGKGRRS